MFKRYAVLTGIILSLILLFIATLYYPGGSQYDKNAVGFDWKNNYLTNLFGSTGVNGSANPGQPWAIGGMFMLCAGFALFFFHFSKKISAKSPAGVIRYFGIAAMICAFLAVTPYHDIMVMLASTCALVSMFYITVFLFRSKRLFLKILAVFCLLCFYSSNYMYYTRSYLYLLPVMQKITILTVMIWVLGLEYFTTDADFLSVKNGKRSSINKM